MSGPADDTEAPAASEEPVAPPTGVQSPASGESSPAPQATPPGLRERARIRRRVRYLRQLREIQLRDIGGFLVEQLRLGRENPDVVRTKLAGAAETDRELRALEGALVERRPLREVREAGVGGACQHCGSVHGSSDRFCSWCGREL
jgi:hypothetical protein